MRYVITYVSTADYSLEESEVERLLIESEISNNENNLSGILLFSEGNFLQVLEGKKETILSLYETILNDKRHHSVLKILGKDISQELYNGYQSKFLSEHSKFKENKLEAYLKPLCVLDEVSQKVVGNILNVFLKN